MKARSLRPLADIKMTGERDKIARQTEGHVLFELVSIGTVNVDCQNVGCKSIHDFLRTVHCRHQISADMLTWHLDQNIS